MMNKEEMHKQSVHLKQLFSNKFIYERSYSIDDVNDSTSEMNFSIGFPIIISVAFSPLVLIKLFKNKENASNYIYYLLIGVICVFMATFYFPWNKLPNFVTFIQVPFRLLMPATFLLSVSSGLTLYYLSEKINIYHIFIGIVIIFLYISPYFDNLRYDDLYTEYPLLTENNSYLTCANFEYLPIKARNNMKYIRERDKSVKILEGNALIDDEEKNGSNIKFTISNNKDKLVLELPFIFYPGYTCELNGNVINYEESNNGFIKVEIDNEDGNVLLNYTGTNIMNITKCISIVCSIIFIIYIFVRIIYNYFIIQLLDKKIKIFNCNESIFYKKL